MEASRHFAEEALPVHDGPLSLTAVPDGPPDDPAVLEARLRQRRWKSTGDGGDSALDDETELAEVIPLRPLQPDYPPEWTENPENVQLLRHIRAQNRVEDTVTDRVGHLRKLLQDRASERAARVGAPPTEVPTIMALTLQEAPGRTIYIEHDYDGHISEIFVQKEGQLIASYGRVRVESPGGHMRLLTRTDRELERPDLSLAQLSRRIFKAPVVDIRSY